MNTDFDSMVELDALIKRYGKGHGHLINVKDNSFVLVAHTNKLLMEAGWPDDAREKALDFAKAGDREHMIGVISALLDNKDPKKDSVYVGEDAKYNQFIPKE